MGTAHLDHVELTFPVGTLTPEVRTAIDSFWCDVIGWSSREHFVYGTSHHMLKIDDQQFLLLGEVEDAMKPAPENFFGDLKTVHTEYVGNDYRISDQLADDWVTFVPHFAVKYETVAEIDDLLARCERFQARDPGLLIKDFPLFETGRGKGTSRNVLVRYILPMWVELHASDEDPEWTGTGV